jgi:glycosyltransferase involved in cell wall biosynthesis
MNLVIVVPAWNEEKTIAGVISDLKNHGYNNIVVVDDGSVDNSGVRAKGLGARVLTHIVNRGLGAALGTGFAYAKSFGADVVVTFDSDGQHNAEDIKNLVKPIVNNTADVVIGSRMTAYRKLMPVSRLLISYLANLLTYLLYGFWSSDSQSGLRAFNKKALEKIVIKTDRMEISSEFLKEIKRNKLRYAEVPIKPVFLKGRIGQDNKGYWNSISIGVKMLLRLFR